MNQTRFLPPYIFHVFQNLNRTEREDIEDGLLLKDLPLLKKELERQGIKTPDEIFLSEARVGLSELGDYTRVFIQHPNMVETRSAYYVDLWSGHADNLWSMVYGGYTG